MIGRRRTHRAPQAAPALVQVVGRVFTGSTNVATMSFSPTVATKQGNSLIAFVKYGGGSLLPASGTVTDSKGNTWVEDHAYTPGSGATVNVYRAANAAALGTSDTITLTAPASQGNWGMIVAEVSGLAHGRDATAQAAALPGTTVTVNQTTQTAYAKEIAFTAFFEGGSSANVSYTPSTGWTQIGAGDPAAAVGLAYQLLSARGTQSATWTSPNNVNCAADIVTYG